MKVGIFYIALAGFGLLLPLGSEAQKVKWTTFEHLSDSIRKEPKPILIFIHTDWCKFCKMQDKNTFTNSEVVKVLEDEFYALKLNGESKSPIKFLNRIYNHKSNGAQTGSHELADYLGKKGGELVYPTTVLLTPQLTVATRQTGFLSSDDLLKYLEEF